MSDTKLRCLDCNQTISIDASKCPNCGREHPTLKNAVMGTAKGLVFALAIVILSLALPQWLVDDVGGASTWYFLAVVTAVISFVSSFGLYWVRKSVVEARMRGERHQLESMPTLEEWFDKNYPEWTSKLPGHDPEANRKENQ